MKIRYLAFKIFLIFFIVYGIGCKKKNQESQLLKRDCQEIIQSTQKWYSELDSKLSLEIGYSRITFLDIGKPPETLSNQELTFTNQNGSFNISDRSATQYTLTATGMEEKSLRYVVTKADIVKESELIKAN